MDKIRYGVIGAGFFGEKHIEVLSTLPNVDVVGVCRRSMQPLKEIAEKYNIPNTYTAYNELLANKEIDAVSITTHVNDHLQPAIDALKAGKHVFLEKPMADSVEDCDAIIEAAKSAKGKFMVGHICRFDTRISLAKESIDKGSIGRIVSMHAARNLPADISAGVLDKISPLMGDGIHDTDLMLWLTGSQVKTVYAQNIRIRNFKNPDIGWAMYRFDNDAVGVIETVWYLPENTPFVIDARMEIIGTEGAIYIDCGNTGLIIDDRTGIHKPDTVYWPNLFGRRVGVLRNELSYFVECINTGKSPDIITPEESRMAVAVICAAEQSAASGEVIKM